MTFINGLYTAGFTKQDIPIVSFVEIHPST